MVPCWRNWEIRTCAFPSRTPSAGRGRIESGAASLDLLAVGSLQFEAPESDRYPCLALAADAMRAGGTAPAILNAANEVAVQAFLDRQIPFSAIPATIRYALERCSVHEANSLELILEDDAAARAAARHCLAAGRRAATL